MIFTQFKNELFQFAWRHETSTLGIKAFPMGNKLFNIVFWDQELSTFYLHEETVNSDGDENVEEDLGDN